jgi:hypothetical protein
MLTAQEAREIALALPEAIEQDHHGRPSFRVAGKIFGTLWTAEAMNVMPGEGRIRAAVEEAPEEAWARRAPRRLLGKPDDATA